MLLAEKSYLQENKQQSIDFYKKALTFDGEKDGEILILFNIAIIYDEIGQWNDSKIYYEKILEIEPHNHEAMFQLAMLNERMGDIEEALNLYCTITDINPDFKGAYFNAAIILDEMGKLNAAIQCYEEVLKIEPEHYHALNNIGSIYEELGEYEKAYEMVKKSIAINSNFYKSLFNMGVIYNRLGDQDMAMKYYKKSMTKNPKYPYVYLNQSAIFIEKKKYHKAIDILTEGISNIDHGDLYYNRACCYSIIGEKESAICDIKIALALNPDLMDWVWRDKDFENLYDNEEFRRMNNID